MSSPYQIYQPVRHGNKRRLVSPQHTHVQDSQMAYQPTASNQEVLRSLIHENVKDRQRQQYYSTLASYQNAVAYQDNNAHRSHWEETRLEDTSHANCFDFEKECRLIYPQSKTEATPQERYAAHGGDPWSSMNYPHRAMESSLHEEIVNEKLRRGEENMKRYNRAQSRNHSVYSVGPQSRYGDYEPHIAFDEGQREQAWKDRVDTQKAIEHAGSGFEYYSDDSGYPSSIDL